MKVSKRDGLVEEYDFAKISRAAERAFISAGKVMTEEFTIQLRTKFDKFIAKYENSEDKDEPLHIEKIQDILKKFLRKTGNRTVADAFVEYREWRNNVRNQRSELMQSIVEKLQGRNIENQNANVDELSFGGRKGEANSILTSDYALNNCMTKMSKDNHVNGRIYIHDRDSYALGMHNCLTVPFDKILENGFVTRQGDVRKPNCINTACQLIAVIFQIQSQQQFGGVSASHIDWTMVPYIRKSFEKHYVLQYLESCDDFYSLDIEGMSRPELKRWVSKHVEEFFDKTGLKDEDFRFDNKAGLDPVYYQRALYETRKEVEQAVEGLYHNLNHLQSRSGNQLPFSSLNYGTCTLPEGRMFTKALLEGSIDGIGKHHNTPIFPCGIFQYWKGVNGQPGDPNYDLYRLALKSTSQRLYPNYANCMWSGNEGFDPNDPKTYFSTMGCHAKGTKIVMHDGTRKNVEDIVVGDKLMGVDSTPRVVEKLISGNSKMYKVIQSRGNEYIVNDGHILSLVYSVSRKYKNYKKGDIVNMTINEYLSLPDYIRRHFKGYKSSYELSEKTYDIPPYILGLWLGDGNSHSTKFSVNKSETKILDDLKLYAETINKKVNIKDMKDEYCYEVAISDRSNVNDGNRFRQALIKYNLMGNKHIPEEYFYGSKEQRSALLAGLINTDGWARTGGNRQTVCFGNTNIDLINGVKRIADSLGYTTNIIKARGSVIGTGICEGCQLKPYYHVSIHRFDDVHLMDNKKVKVSDSIRNFSTSTLKIEELENDDFFGFELDGDKLYLLDDCTVTHNCRTANGYDINGFGQLKDGRGNICPVTIIMPKMAMEAIESLDLMKYIDAERERVEAYNAELDAKGDTESERRVVVLHMIPEIMKSSDAIFEQFMKIFDRALGEAKDMLIERFEFICAQPAASARFMYENGTMEGYDGKDVRSALKHGTLAIGQIALAETLQILAGCDHTTAIGMKLAQKIEKLAFDRCAEFKEKYKLNFGVYYTPKHRYHWVA